MTELSVIIFAFDEESNIAPVLRELVDWLSTHEPSSEIVFVDDGSRDGTLDAAKRALAGFPATFLRHETNGGIGAALKTGVDASRGDFVTFLPADGQIAPDAIATLRAAQDGVDVVFSVYDHRDDGAFRTVMSWGVRTLIRAVHGVTMQSDGPYLFRRSLFDRSQLEPDTFFLNFELPIRVVDAGLPHRVVTIACRPRLSGFSKSAGLRRIVGVARDLGELRVRRTRASLARLLGGPLDP
jgi:dolichol-phosphate mannosyltransferase